MPTEEIVVSYKQGCFGLGSMFVGISGGVALGYLTQVTTQRPLIKISSIPQLERLIKKIPQSNLINGPKQIQLVRLALQGLGSSLAYCYLECKFQRGHRRTMFDAGLAGGITGGAFGLRGIPGGALGAGYGAGGFALYAAVVQLLFR